MDTPAARAFSSAAPWFLEVAARAQGHLDEVALGAWSVRDLLGRTGRSLSTVETCLDAAADRDLAVELDDAAAYHLAALGSQAAASDGAASALLALTGRRAPRAAR